MGLSANRAKKPTTSKSEPPYSTHLSLMTNQRGIPLSALQNASEHNYHVGLHLFSTSTSSNEATETKRADKLPSFATTGNIASHKAPIPTERDIAMAGGVWAVTSAKRDKLGELKGALNEDQDTLDDLATDDELLDLHLADGIKLIAKVTDGGLDNASSDVPQKGNDANSTAMILNEFSEWLDKQRSDPSQPNDIDRTMLGMKLEVISAKIDKLLENVPSDRCLRNIRNFLDPEDISDQLKDCPDEVNSLGCSSNENLDINTARFWDSVIRYRLLLTKSAIEHLMMSWNILTTVSNGDIDRAAAEGIALESELKTVSLENIIAFLQKFVSGSSSDRTSAAWDLIDRDHDGSLDEEEMNQAVHLCLGIEVKAMQTLFEETIDVFPVRAPLSSMDDIDNLAATPKGWRQKRAEKKTKKLLLKMFQQSCKKHFEVEVEINHRLRCIYAWANKVDQDNQLKSVLVDEEVGWTGRKRYVELSPKITEAEFREVQRIHFKHLDRLGSEIVSSFREDLWVLQGKRRERKDLIRNSFLFLTAVSAVDYVIVLL